MPIANEHGLVLIIGNTPVASVTLHQEVHIMPVRRCADVGPANQALRADRRLSEVVPVYAAPDQDVCGVDM